MIVDLNELASPAEVACDLCVVGAGACGIALGLEFLDSRHRVVILESGGDSPDPETSALYRAEVSGFPHRGSHVGRERVFGGTTTVWGGQVLPFFPIDFEARPWVPESGWPMTADDLESYHARACDVIGVPRMGPDRPLALELHAQSLDLAPGGLERVFSQWTRRPNFAANYRSAFAKSSNVDVMLHSNAVNIVANESAGAVEAIQVRSLSGRIGTVRARHFVLCNGGIEVARLLLASRDPQTHGLGNRNGLVGRYFQDHVAVTCGTVYPSSRKRLQGLFQQYLRRDAKYLPKLHATEAMQRSSRILNVIGNISVSWAGISDLLELKQFVGSLKRGRRAPLPRISVGRALANIWPLGQVAWQRLATGRAWTPGMGPIVLEAHCEQEPDRDSRITLSPECDALGMPRARVHWKPTAASWRSIDTFARKVAAEFERLDLGRVELGLPDAADHDSWRRVASDTFHHMGTTRMHADPLRGVVDAECRMHTHANLHIGGSAVFPTGGCSNPTMTAIALCIRLADRLKERLRG